MIRRIRRLGIVVFLALAAQIGPAAAHPHVFIVNRVAFHVADGQVTGLSLSWEFDDLFSGGLIYDFDIDADGRFDAEETAAIEANAFSYLKNFDYFTYLWVDDQPVKPIAVSDFSASYEGGLVSYRFTVALPTPFDPRVTRFKAEVNDREYYVDVVLAADEPVSFEGDGSLDCTAAIVEDIENPYYFDLIYPQAILLECP